MTRYYDPKIGRFINADSFEYLEPKTINGLNLYAYCGNNPVMYCDPTGHFLLELGVVLFGVVGVLGVALMIGAAGVIIGVVAPGIGDVLKQIGAGFFTLVELLTKSIFGSENVETFSEWLTRAPSQPHKYNEPDDWFLDELKATME